MNYLLDTNVISELVKPTPNESLLKWIDGIPSENLYLSVISIGEIRKGIAGIQHSQSSRYVGAVTKQK